MKIALELMAGLVGAILTTAALWIIFLMFRAGKGAGRLRAKTIDRVLRLKPGRVTRELGWELSDTPSETEFVSALAETFKQAGGNVLRHDSDQLVVFFGSRADAKMHGLWKADLMSSPTRVCIKTGDFGGRLWLQIRLDEDFGFQLFLGPVRKRFHDRYQQVFDRIAQVIEPAIAPYDPKKVRILFGS